MAFSVGQGSGSGAAVSPQRAHVLLCRPHAQVPLRMIFNYIAPKLTSHYLFQFPVAASGQGHPLRGNVDLDVLIE